MSDAPRLLGAQELALIDALGDGAVWIRPRGVSMRPTLIEGDAVALASARARWGSIALVVHGGKLWLHRLVWRRGGRWLLWGDARLRPDGWVQERQILAIAVARRRDDRPVRDLERGRARFAGMCGAVLRRPLRSMRRRLRADAQRAALFRVPESETQKR